MPVNLNRLPERYLRPAAPNPLFWLLVLITLLLSSLLLYHWLLPDLPQNKRWSLVVATALIAWLLLLWCRVMVHLLQQIQANAWDQQREARILQQTAQGRRALQIVAAHCTTGHAADLQFTPIVDALLANQPIINQQTAWNGERNLFHSRLAVAPKLSVQQLLSNAFNQLLRQLSDSLDLFPAQQPIDLLLECHSSLPETEIQALWQQAWQQQRGLTPINWISRRGLAAVDHWLDQQINQSAPLLVIALQIAPTAPALSAEMLVGLLLANRSIPLAVRTHALLHRPEASSAAYPALSRALLQTADWVPLEDQAIKQLWLTGLPTASEGYLSAMRSLTHPPLSALQPGEQVHHFEQFLGYPGDAGCWLAIAAAAQSIGSVAEPHLVIAGTAHAEQLWSVVVAPNALQTRDN
ncbi:hypothetical protein [Serratia microhaemolytica]|uniref:hypothetical protein n=1 Tax=Serratia microhaemolytica TaxID=2675110 RepID=UPI000FDEE5C5|nr:hypothetical protein [Serratia microhaemolytica]